METREDFYVTLCSNVNNTSFQNKIGNFVTQLPAPIILDASWRVGLSEIHFTNSWCNLRTPNRVQLKNSYKESADVFNSYAALDAGRYDDIEALIDEITARAQSSKDNKVQTLPKLNIDHFTRRISMTCGVNADGEPIYFDFDKELSDMLGASAGFSSSYAHGIVNLEDEHVEVNPNVSEEDTFTANGSYDLTGGIHSLFVYCDIVDYSIVGDTKAQLLRMAHIPAESKFGGAIVDRYENPHYLPLSTKEISSIEVDIKDDTDTPIVFEFGRVKLVLHFVKNG